MNAKYAIRGKKTIKERIFSKFMNVLSTKRLRKCKAPYMEKRTLSGKLIFAFIRTVLYQTVKCMQM